MASKFTLFIPTADIHYLYTMYLNILFSIGNDENDLNQLLHVIDGISCNMPKPVTGVAMHAWSLNSVSMLLPPGVFCGTTVSVHCYHQVCFVVQQYQYTATTRCVLWYNSISTLLPPGVFCGTTVSVHCYHQVCFVVQQCQYTATTRCVL